MKRVFFSIAISLSVLFSINAQTSVNDINVKYPQKMGNLRFKTNYIVFPSIYNTETKTDTVKFYNDGNKIIKLSLSNVPGHITCDLLQKEVKPGEAGGIVVKYDATKVNDFGFVMGRFNIVTNDSASLQKIISVSANIVEDFSKMTSEQKANAPKIVFDNVKFNFGTITEGEIVKHDFIFKNEGKSELIVRKTKASCGCTAISPNKTNLKSGETSQVGISFNSSGRTGKQIKNITVISNDPEKSTTILTIEGEVKPKEESKQ